MNEDDDKQTDDVFVHFTDEALKHVLHFDHEIRGRLVENMIKLTAEEHKLLVAELAKLEANATQLAPPATKRATPPAPAEFLLAFIAPKNSAQAFLGDLEELFQKNAERFGEPQARRMYWFEVARSFGPLVWQWIKRMGFVTLVVDYVRSKFGL
ncbi:permease prefix domain 2-containing transporter [Bradyrhizobium sp. Pa8]|uniref:permease prefix domain 2-containing transporter n=1 Tax=Bradyrhizobium sp. Pa8 TaxID=3386552 RepID=UPI00403F016C